MTKKHQQSQPDWASGKEQAGEYQVIRQDLIRVVVLNALYLGGILTVYLVNNRQHFLERWFAQWLNF